MTKIPGDIWKRKHLENVTLVLKSTKGQFYKTTWFGEVQRCMLATQKSCQFRNFKSWSNFPSYKIEDFPKSCHLSKSERNSRFSFLVEIQILLLFLVKDNVPSFPSSSLFLLKDTLLSLTTSLPRRIAGITVLIISGFPGEENTSF